jgi:hypothetical protein
MRVVLTIILASLILPVSVVAQDPPQSSKPQARAQSSAGEEDSAAPAHPTKAPNTVEAPIPVTTEARPFIHLGPIRQPPAAAGYAAAFNVSAGYSVTNLWLPSSGQASLNGMDLSFSADSSQRFGATVDLGYARASNAFGTGRELNVLSYLIGPVFYPTNGNLVTTSAHFLIGGARVSGPFPNATGGISAGYVHYPAWAFGGGAEYHLSPAFGFRVSVDYLRTHFYNSAQAVRGQNDIRVVNSLVYYIAAPIRRRR